MPKSTEPPKPVKLPDWTGFKLAMLTNPTYQRVSQISENRLSVNRIETFFSIQGDEWQIVSQLWVQMLNGVADASKPTDTEITAWNQIVNSTHMPILFNENGFLTVVQTDG